MGLSLSNIGGRLVGDNEVGKPADSGCVVTLCVRHLSSPVAVLNRFRRFTGRWGDSAGSEVVLSGVDDRGGGEEGVGVLRKLGAAENWADTCGASCAGGVPGTNSSSSGNNGDSGMKAYGE